MLRNLFWACVTSKADLLFVILPILIIHWSSQKKPINYLKLLWILIVFLVFAVPLVEAFRLSWYDSQIGFDRLTLNNINLILNKLTEINIIQILELTLSRLHAFDSNTIISSYR